MKSPVEGGLLDGQLRPRPLVTAKGRQAFAHYQKGIGWHIYIWVKSKGVWQFYKSVEGKTEQDLLDYMDSDPLLKN